MGDGRPAYPHQSEPDVFREALAYTAGEQGFTPTLVEKDYYCSLILRHFFSRPTPLVFRGGTCLSKVYTRFYRLSEDLDLVIPVGANVSPARRRSLIEPVRTSFAGLAEAIPGTAISSDLEGHNRSRQYVGEVEYRSAAAGNMDRIKVEIGLREPLLSPSQQKPARTLAINPFSLLPLLPEFPLKAMSLKEAYAEKARAAMTRLEPAIRDFYDLSYAVREQALDVFDAEFLSMVRSKLEVPGGAAVRLSAERREELDRQIEGRLRPVLRPQDFNEFDLRRAFELVQAIVQRL